MKIFWKQWRITIGVTSKTTEPAQVPFCFLIVSQPSLWYNRCGWLDVKHQVTYLRQPAGFAQGELINGSAVIMTGIHISVHNHQKKTYWITVWPSSQVCERERERERESVENKTKQKTESNKQANKTKQKQANKQTTATTTTKTNSIQFIFFFNHPTR